MEKEIKVIAEDEVEVITTKDTKPEIELTEEQAKIGAAQVSELIHMLDCYATPRERLEKKIKGFEEQLETLSIDNYRYKQIESKLLLLEKKLNPKYVHKHSNVKGVAKVPYINKNKKK